MIDIQIKVNNQQKIALASKEYRVIHIGFTVGAGDLRGELHVSATLHDFTSKLLKTIEIPSGDIVTIGSNIKSDEKSCYTEKKISQYRNVYRKSNTGKVCKYQFHMSVDNEERYLNFTTDLAHMTLNYTCFIDKAENEISLGNVNAIGDEQWMTARLFEKQNIEFLFLVNN